MHLKYSFKKKKKKSIDHIFGFCRASSIPLLQAEGQESVSKPDANKSCPQTSCSTFMTLPSDDSKQLQYISACKTAYDQCTTMPVP